MPKGYVSLSGCSLTIGERVEHQYFCVHLIPKTLKLTTFVGMEVGTKVNLEIDSQTREVVQKVLRMF